MAPLGEKLALLYHKIERAYLADRRDTVPAIDVIARIDTTIEIEVDAGFVPEASHLSRLAVSTSKVLEIALSGVLKRG